MGDRFHIKESRNALYWFCLILGIVMIGMMVMKFLLPELKIPSQLIIAYPVILVVYVAVKEVVRWTGETHVTKLGEILVILWWGAFILMSITEFVLGFTGVSDNKFIVPEEILTTCIEVLVIFGCSEISKKLHLAKNNRRKENDPAHKETKS